MREFTEDIERRREQDRRLNAGKKANPFFEINKQRQELAKQMPKIKRSETSSSQIIPCPPFPIISSTVPESNTSSAVQSESTSSIESLLAFGDLFESDFEDEMGQIEAQMAELLYSPAPIRSRRAVINLISPSHPSSTAKRLQFTDSNESNLPDLHLQ